VTDLESRKEQLSSYDAQTVARREHIEKLKADIRSLEEGNRRLEPAVSSARRSASR